MIDALADWINAQNFDGDIVVCHPAQELLCKESIHANTSIDMDSGIFINPVAPTLLVTHNCPENEVWKRESGAFRLITVGVHGAGLLAQLR